MLEQGQSLTPYSLPDELLAIPQIFAAFNYTSFQTFPDGLLAISQIFAAFNHASFQPFLDRLLAILRCLLLKFLKLLTLAMNSNIIWDLFYIARNMLKIFLYFILDSYTGLEFVLKFPSVYFVFEFAGYIILNTG